jgi:hypothetical protein
MDDVLLLLLLLLLLLSPLSFSMSTLTDSFHFALASAARTSSFMPM